MLTRGMHPYRALVAAACALLAVPAAAQTYKDIRALGGANAFCRPALRGQETIRALFRDARSEIEFVLGESGWAGDPADVFRAVEAGQVRDVDVPVGTTFEWMALKRGGRPFVARDLRWAGEGPFSAFALDVVSRGTAYRFVVPKPCGNLALLSADAVPLTCSLTASPARVCVGQPVSIEVRGTAGPQLEVRALHPDGTSEELGAPAQPGAGARFSRTFTRPGSYRFVGVDPSGTELCTAQVEVGPCPPTCALAVSEEEVFTHEPFTLDLGGSKAQVGSIAGARVTILDHRRFPIGTIDVDASLRREVAMPRRGSYRLSAVVIDSVGQESLPCEVRLDVLPRHGLVVDLLAGVERRWRDEFPRDRTAPIVGGKVGLEYLHSPRVRIVAAVGGNLNLRDEDNSGLHVDGEINYDPMPWFVGGGLGIWDFSHSDTAALVALAHAGVDLPWRLGREPVEVKVEGRYFLTHPDNVENNFVAWGGLRFHP